MNILFNDILQDSDAPGEIKKPSLAYYINNNPGSDLFDGGGAGSVYDDDIDGGYADTIFDEVYDGGDILLEKEFEIVLGKPHTINSFGAGNTDSKLFRIFLIDVNDNIFTHTFKFDGNGLYMLGKEYKEIKQVNLMFSGTRIGRCGSGYAVNLKTAVAKEPSLVSTNKPRTTLSGQVIEGLGGYNYWRISLDTRYKIDKDILNNIIEGHRQLSRGYPFFISFDDEEKLPIGRMYGVDASQQELSFESSINKTLFSRRWVFEERF